MTTAAPARPEPPALASLAHAPRVLLAAVARTSPTLASGWGLTALLAVLAGVGRVVAPLAVQRTVDEGLRHVGTAVAVGALGLVVAGTASYALNLRLQGRVEAAIAGMRRDGLARVHDMPAATVDRLSSADLLSRVTSDLDQTTTFLQGGGIQLVTNTAQVLVATIVMTVYSWVLTVPVLLLGGALLLVMRTLQRAVAARFDVVRRDLARMQGVVAESIVGASVIRATGTGPRTVDKLDEAVERARDSQLRTLAPLHGNTSLGELAISTMTVTVILGGVWWGVVGHPAVPRVTTGQVIAMVFLVTLFVRPLQFLVQALGEAQNAVTGWRRSLELVTTPSGVVGGESGRGTALPPGPVSVSVSDVSVRYGDGPLVLHGVTTEIAAGESIAVVGHTGSGKSTFAKLLTRRVVPASGTVRLSGVPLEALADSSLARRVVIVPQDPFLFAGTIRDNVVLGAPGASDEQLLAAFNGLGLEGWLSGLADGLGTHVGLRGDRLSAGERQLVALVRTALADPDLVVLDEATSGVDPATDVVVQEALVRLTEGRTTISIAHRMVTAATADRVLVFDDGRIVQHGPHAALLDEDGPYAALVAAWNHR